MQTAPRRLHLKGKKPHRVWWRKPRASIPRNTAQPWLITQVFRIEGCCFFYAQIRLLPVM